jgi:hypothetical protein
MKLYRTPAAFSSAFADFPEDASYALVILNEIPNHHDVSTIREAARLCDVVIAFSTVPVRVPEMLEKVGCDALLIFTEQETPVHITGTNTVPFIPFMQAVLAVLPSIVLVNSAQTPWLYGLKDLLNTFPTLFTPRLWVTPDMTLSEVEQHWLKVVMQTRLGKVESCGALMAALTQQLEQQMPVRGVSGLACLTAEGLVTDNLKKVKWLSLRVATAAEDVPITVPYPIKRSL